VRLPSALRRCWFAFAFASSTNDQGIVEEILLSSACLTYMFAELLRRLQSSQLKSGDLVKGRAWYVYMNIYRNEAQMQSVKPPI